MESQQNPIKTLYLAFIGEVPSEPVQAKGMTRSTGMTRGGWGSSAQFTSGALPTHMAGVDTERMAQQMFASMQWALQTQDKKILPFQVDEQRYNAFPQRSVVQVIDLLTQQPDPENNITFKVQITQPFANTDLTLVSKKPVHLQAVTDMYEQNGAPKGNWMLFTEEQIQWLLEEKKLNAAMINQDRMRQGCWHLELEDEYWLDANASGDQYLTDMCGAEEPTFQIQAKITSAEIEEEGAAGAGYVLRVQRTQNLVAGSKPSSTWSYCANPSDDEAMPVVEKKKTQMFFFRFDIFGGKIPTTTTYSITTECGICMCTHSTFLVAGCGHAFCQGCVAQLADANAVVKCPYCRATSSSDDMVSVPFPEQAVPACFKTIDDHVAEALKAQEDKALAWVNEEFGNHWFLRNESPALQPPQGGSARKKSYEEDAEHAAGPAFKTAKRDDGCDVIIIDD